jgi:hypothetical protein
MNMFLISEILCESGVCRTRLKPDERVYFAGGLFGYVSQKGSLSRLVSQKVTKKRDLLLKKGMTIVNLGMV